MPVLVRADSVQTSPEHSPISTVEGATSARWSQGAPVAALPPHMSHPMPGPVPPSMMPPPPGALPPGTMIAPNGQLVPSGPMPPPHLHRSMSQPMCPMDHNMPRHPPYIGQPEFRIYELNRRLHQRTEESDNLWWDAFTNEFFEDDATLTLVFCLEDGLKRYTIARTLIPRYFRSIFEGGVTDMQIVLKHAKEVFHPQQMIALDCDKASLVTQHGKPMFTKVISEGRMILEFGFDELMRIRTWHFTTRVHREMLPRSAVVIQDSAMIEQLSKNITRQGLTNYTLNFLRLCVILEPMQELMSRHKAYGLTPRDCLKTTLFQKWQRMVAPPGQCPRRSHAPSDQDTTPPPVDSVAGATITPAAVAAARSKTTKTSRQPNKRRKRKSNTPAATNTPPGGKQKRSPLQCGPMSSSIPIVGGGGGVGGDQMSVFGGSVGPPQCDEMGAGFGDVMVVGEPTLMGGEFGDEDERIITRLENSGPDQNSGPGGCLPPPLMPASLLADHQHHLQQQQQQRHLCMAEDVKDPKIKSGQFPSPSILGGPLEPQPPGQWSDKTSNLANITIKSE